MRAIRRTSYNIYQIQKFLISISPFYLHFRHHQEFFHLSISLLILNFHNSECLSDLMHKCRMSCEAIVLVAYCPNREIKLKVKQISLQIFNTVSYILIVISHVICTYLQSRCQTMLGGFIYYISSLNACLFRNSGNFRTNSTEEMFLLSEEMCEILLSSQY